MDEEAKRRARIEMRAAELAEKMAKLAEVADLLADVSIDVGCAAQELTAALLPPEAEVMDHGIPKQA